MFRLFGPQVAHLRLRFRVLISREGFVSWVRLQGSGLRGLSKTTSYGVLVWLQGSGLRGRTISCGVLDLAALHHLKIQYAAMPQRPGEKNNIARKNLIGGVKQKNISRR